MPTFFTRRYTRKNVPAAEVAIGVAILLLAAGIVVALVATVRPSSKKLFEASPKYLNAGAEPRELRVAAQMMPVMAPSWRLAGRVEARPADAVSDWAGETIDVLRSNGLSWAYRGRFEMSGAGGPSATVTVYDVGSPQHAVAIAKLRQPSGATPCSLGRGGWAAGPRTGFWSGRYYTETEATGAEAAKTAVDMAKAAASLQLSYAAPVATSATASAGPTVPAAPKRPEHFPEIAGVGWTSPDDVKHFDKDNLYEKIDGKAGMFLGYLFVGLDFATYRRTDKGWAFDVYLYDMGEPLNAFGVYRVERSPDAAVRPLGREGYTSGASVFFWKGKYYVNVLGPPDQADAAGAAEQVAAAVEKTIADDGKPLWAEKVFPATGQKKGSLGYKATDALGYGFLRQLFLAEYDAGGKTYQLFIHRAADPAAAKALFEQYVEAVKKYNKLVSRKPSQGGEMLVSESLGVFEAAFYKGALFAGVTECPDAAMAEKQATAFCDGLDAAAIAAMAPAPSSAPAAAQESSGSQEPGGNGGEQAETEH
jgi:hypothetical protein